MRNDDVRRTAWCWDVYDGNKRLQPVLADCKTEALTVALDRYGPIESVRAGMLYEEFEKFFRVESRIPESEFPA